MNELAYMYRPCTPQFHRGTRSVDNYKKLNRIEEGTYGIVYRAQEKATGTIVALKRLKLEKEREGFPLTSLREIHALMQSLPVHANIVRVREIAVGQDLHHVFMVMEYVEHDLKYLLDKYGRDLFTLAEVKTVLQQLLSATACLHAHWMSHRDIKPSNLLMSHQGQMKLADFGLARKVALPLLAHQHLTPVVVTLWYRAPELLLGEKMYTNAIDIWSVGCVFAELLIGEPLFPGQGEIDQLAKIFNVCGNPSESTWPGFSSLPNSKFLSFPKQYFNNTRKLFPMLSDSGLDLINKLLCLNPAERISAHGALLHPWFSESPAPKDPSLFPTWPFRTVKDTVQNTKDLYV